jgi:hypothetical protein
MLHRGLRMLRLALGALFASVATLARAAELETTHLFGFTLGSDVNAVGEKEAESEAFGRFGKSTGTYSALSQALGVKFIPVQNFSIEPVVSVTRFDLSGVPGLDDRRQLTYEAASLEMHYRLLNREQALFGLTVGFDPHWVRVDDTSGAPVDRYGAALLLIADKELVEKLLFAAFNFIFEPNSTRSRITGVWQRASELGVSAALSMQIRPGVLIGAEARYMNSFDGFGIDRFAGNALFVGPTFYAKFSEKFWMSAGWTIQVTGRAVNEIGTLNLTNFERSHAILRFGYNF